MDPINTLEWLSSPGAIWLIVTIIGGVVGTLIVVLRFRRAISIETTKQEEKLQEDFKPDVVDNLSNLLIQNFRVLNTYYSENLRQARTSTIASISIAIIGFIVIIVGNVITFVANEALLGTISSSAGIVSQAVAALFFKQNRVFLEQMQDSLGKLVSTQYLMTSVSLTKQMNEVLRDQEIHEINKHLRTLMDSFHDMKKEAA